MSRGTRANGIALSCALAALVSGCASHSTRLDAALLQPDERHTSVSVDALVVERGREHAIVPMPELSMRWGHSETWDIGVTAGVSDLRATARVRLGEAGGFRVVVVPGIGLGMALVTNNGTDVLRARAILRVIVDRRVSERVAVIAGVKPDLVLATPATLFRGYTADTRLLFEPGLVVGARIRTSRGLTLWPELDVHVPYALAGGREPFILQAGLGLGF